MDNFDNMNNTDNEKVIDNPPGIAADEHSQTIEDTAPEKEENFFSVDEEAFTADNVEEQYDNYTHEDQTSFNRVNFSPAESYPVDVSKEKISKGVKIFTLIMAVVILLTASCVTGYLFGINDVFSDKGLNLAAKPHLKDQYTPAQVYDKLNKSIVGIRVYNIAGQMGDASGIIYSKDGYIITNDHIYSSISSPYFRVFMYDGTEYDAEYVAGDTVSDLAVLKIKGVKNLSVPQFGNPGEMACGENVVAIGRPSNATDKSSVTSGVISLLRRRVTTTSSYSASLIQTDSAINPGSSGGALCNMYGQVIGVTSSKLVATGYDSFGFAIPTTTVKRVAEQLIKHGKVVDRAKLGITYTEINSVTADVAGYQSTGLLVDSVSSDSDAAGKITKGDIITHINDTLITNDDMVLDIIEASKAGDKVNLTVLNEKGSTKTYEIVLKANVGESSYSSAKPDTSNSESDNSDGGAFDFPKGE